MEAIEFIQNYQTYVVEISQVVKPELQPVIDDLRLTDPHNLFKPETWFLDLNSAKGFVWQLFMSEFRKMKAV